MNWFLYFLMVFVLAASFFVSPVLFVVLLIAFTLIGGALLNERGG